MVLFFFFSKKISRERTIDKQTKETPKNRGVHVNAAYSWNKRKMLPCESTYSPDYPDHLLQCIQVSLAVNVASECGFTEEHYKALQKLQRDFGPYHFNVLAFPCNQFGQQEPGSDKEIDSFVRRVYRASFPLFSKIAVVGTGANNVYKYLIESSGKEPDWNFWKYLIDVNGKVVDAWGPKVSIEEIRPKVAEMPNHVCVGDQVFLEVLR
ncbi:glutathione peroxidase 7 isoform X2 [Syngnathoides biaculeatus]|uniref:glutathione peroxidase 7 isoform X2 n=2 Tax=Syngnathoides biaculeatus TaxID=300417 RepID=UPI002ADE8225|nr:glutathione peroxidase 7 isoform X2 [Syngnathoides biaculeatus]